MPNCVSLELQLQQNSVAAFNNQRGLPCYAKASLVQSSARNSRNFRLGVVEEAIASPAVFLRMFIPDLQTWVFNLSIQ